MKKEIFREIEVPEGVEVNIEGDTLIVIGKKGENKRKFRMNKLMFEKKGNKIIIGNKNATKNEKRLINTISSHIRNMLQGIESGFEYKLKIVYSHFPITVEINKNEVVIKNFMGEKIPRKVKLPEKIEISIDDGTITINSFDKELAGQAAANLERGTRIKMKDRRIFQDGIFIISKAGKKI